MYLRQNKKLMSLLNKSAVKKFTLALIASERPHLADKLTRVSSEYYETIEVKLRSAIREHINTMPTNGKTIK